MTLVPGVTGTFGPVYLAAAVLLGALFWGSRGGSGAPPTGIARVLFHYSLLYLALLFVAVAVDAAVR